jgi:hypothetical protein
MILFTTVSRTALRPTQPPIQWVPGAPSLGIKRPGSEADHSPPSSAEVKECVELYLHSPIRLHGVVLNYNTGTYLPYLYLREITWGHASSAEEPRAGPREHGNESSGSIKRGEFLD